MSSALAFNNLPHLRISEVEEEKHNCVSVSSSIPVLTITASLP